MGELNHPKSCIYRWHFPFHHPAELGVSPFLEPLPIEIISSRKNWAIFSLAPADLPGITTYCDHLPMLSDDLFRGHVIAIKQSMGRVTIEITL